MLFLTSTYGDGAAPASASRLLKLLARGRRALPFAVLGFGDRSFPRFCRFAEDVEGALRAQGWPALLPIGRIDRQSAQEFAQWGAALGQAIGTPLVLDHVVARPKTIQALAHRARRLWAGGAGADFGPTLCHPTAKIESRIARAHARTPSENAQIRRRRSCRHPSAGKQRAALLLARLFDGGWRPRDLRAQAARRPMLRPSPRVDARRRHRRIHQAQSGIPSGTRQIAIGLDWRWSRDRPARRHHPPELRASARAPLLGWTTPGLRLSL